MPFENPHAARGEGAGAGVFFDLDGTLADTAPDLTAALNSLRAEVGLEALAIEQVRPCVSGGTPALLGLGFGVGSPEHSTFPALRERFLARYRERLACETRLFPGMAETLRGIEALGLRWGVVTNKVAALTVPLLEALQIAGRAACIVSGDSVPERKPHPAPLLRAAELAAVDPRRSVYIGDSAEDIQAGRAAGMRTLVAGFGYIHPLADPSAWGADALISSAAEILDWVRNWIDAEPNGTRSL